MYVNKTKGDPDVADFLWLAGETGRSETRRNTKWRPTKAVVSQACEPLYDAKVCALYFMYLDSLFCFQVGVWFAAPPGAGKSTLTERVQHYGIWGQDCLWDQDSNQRALQIKAHLETRVLKAHLPDRCRGTGGCSMVYQLSKVLMMLV